MLSTIKNRKEKGFTIIEVLIVLAIAGLILLVVFLAVPALQRNARNTQRNEDIASILGGISEFVNNNNGNIPAAISVSGSTLTIGGSGTNTVPVSLGFYGEGDITLGTGDQNNQANPDTILLLTGAKCDTANIGESVVGSSRSIAALFTLEPTSKQCKES